MKTERRPIAGFTLIEVLVALAIAAFGLMAVFGQLNQTASTAARLREKTFAHWVAQDRLVALRLLDAEFPPIGSTSDEVPMGDVDWKYTQTVTATPNAAMRKVEVAVALASQPERVLARLTGYVRRPPANAQGTPAQAARQADWFEPGTDAGP